jgi:hypothetical protein
MGWYTCWTLHRSVHAAESELYVLLSNITLKLPLDSTTAPSEAKVAVPMFPPLSLHQWVVAGAGGELGVAVESAAAKSMLPRIVEICIF